MIFTACLFGFTFILAGIIIGASPRTMAGIEDLPGDEQRSDKIKSYVRLKKRAFILTGCIILAGSIAATLTGIEKIYVWSIFAPSALLLIGLVYKGYEFSDYKLSYFKMSKQKAAALIFAVALPVFLIVYFSRETRIDISDSQIRFSGLYGETIPVAEIQSIDWWESFPAVQLRTNGFAFGHTLIGYFKIKNAGPAKLYLHAAAPLIRIETASRVYYFNTRSPEPTKKYFRKLLNCKEKFSAPLPATNKQK